MGLILRAKAEKIVNKGGGYPTRTEVSVNERGKKSHHHFQAREKVKGSDCIVFTCPKCGSRNKKCAYEAKGSAGESLSFRCYKCFIEVEVQKPLNLAEGIIGSRESIGVLVGPDNKPIK